MRKTAVALATALLLSALTIAVFAGFASAQAILITITPDGNVSPSTAPIQRFGDLYILTRDVIGTAILVQRSNITLDGNGHTIQGEPRLPTRWGGESSSGGIGLGGVQNVTVKNFSINECATGIGLSYCSNVIISDNNISKTWHPIMYNAISAAISIMDGDYNIITGNRFENNIVGINLWNNSNQNVIVGNTISGSTDEGIRLSESSGNTFYHNNFYNNANVYDSSLSIYSSLDLSINNWDNGKEGNYWSDYNGTDTNGDGIGETPYVIYRQNADNYPLTEPFNSTHYLLKTTPPRIMLLSPLNQTYNQTTISLTFSVDKPVNWINYSLDGQKNITVVGNSTLSVSQGFHNVAVYANDTFGNMGVSETVDFTVGVPEPQPAPFPVVPIAVFFVAAVAIVGAGLLVYFKKCRH